LTVTLNTRQVSAAGGTTICSRSRLLCSSQSFWASSPFDSANYAACQFHRHRHRQRHRHNQNHRHRHRHNYHRHRHNYTDTEFPTELIRIRSNTKLFSRVRMCLECADSQCTALVADLELDRPVISMLTDRERRGGAAAGADWRRRRSAWKSPRNERMEWIPLTMISLEYTTTHVVCTDCH
jgi:hypothetical protein